MRTPHVVFDPRAMDVTINDDELRVDLVDGRTIIVPIVWFPRLARAQQAERDNWELLGDGNGIHWPELDEDISVPRLLLGNEAEENRLRLLA
jgi:hypothetical protein